MAIPVVIERLRYYYPIGNTSPICLTDAIPPRSAAKLLLLGCGDARNVLYTIYSNKSDTCRNLDFLCCDIQPAIHARNILLYSMILDNMHASSPEILWDFYYHMIIDDATLKLIKAQSEKLLAASESPDAWVNSLYGRSFGFCTYYTLEQTRACWTKYVEMAARSVAEQTKATKIFKAEMQRTVTERRGKDMIDLTASRSAGPLMLRAASPISKLSNDYWRTGTTHLDAHKLRSARLVNPTFAWTLLRDHFSVHYVTLPFAAFHLAPIFTDSHFDSDKGKEDAPEHLRYILDRIKQQFFEWCSAFAVKAGTGSLTARFFSGDALAFCRSLDVSQTVPVNVTPWDSTLIDIIRDQLPSPIWGAPTSFDVIETSNLTDHLGLMNILTLCSPLLRRSPSSVLYTETLLSKGEEFRKGFVKRFFGDISSMCFPLDLIPVSHVSRFTGYSNVHDLFIELMNSMSSSPRASMSSSRTQYHERMLWRVATMTKTSDDVQSPQRRFQCDPLAFSKFLFKVYLEMFEHDDAMGKFRNATLGILDFSLTQYVRQSFALFLRLCKRRYEGNWVGVMESLSNLICADKKLMMASNYVQDLYLNLHLFDVWTVDTLNEHKMGIPPVKYVVLTVPRSKLDPITDKPLAKLGTPPIECAIHCLPFSNSFSSISAAFGTFRCDSDCIADAVFVEDPTGWDGRSPLIVRCLVPTWLLARGNAEVALLIRSTTSTVHLVEDFGMELTIFSANARDSQFVRVLNPPPTTPVRPDANEATGSRGLRSSAGGVLLQTTPSAVGFNEGCTAITQVAVRFDVVNPKTQKSLKGGAVVSVSMVAQPVPGKLALRIGSESHLVDIPHCLDLTSVKLRIARKSSYIEIVAPLLSEISRGIKDLWFPITADNTPWNVHRVELDALPLIQSSPKGSASWLNTHVSMMTSDAQRRMLDNRGTIHADVWAQLKQTLHALFNRYTGIQGKGAPFVFGLGQHKGGGGGVQIFIIVTALKHDPSSHTAILDCCVLPLTEDVMEKQGSTIFKTTGPIELVEVSPEEMKLWKHLLPAITERCRTWEHDAASCKYSPYRSQ